MSDPLHVQSDEILSGFHARLATVPERVEGVMRAINDEVERALQTLARCIDAATRDVEDCQSHLDRARADLKSCEESGDPDGGIPYCYSEERRVEEARYELSVAEERLEELRLARRCLREATDSYAVEANRMKMTVEIDLTKAINLLSRTLDRLGDYFATTGVGTQDQLNPWARDLTRTEDSQTDHFSSGHPSTVQCRATGQTFEIGEGYGDGWHAAGGGLVAKVRYQRVRDTLEKHMLCALETEPDKDANHWHVIEYYTFPNATHGTTAVRLRDLVVARVKIDGGQPEQDKRYEINRRFLQKRLKELGVNVEHDEGAP